MGFEPATLYTSNMRAAILYHDKSEHTGIVDAYATEFERYKQKKVDKISLESVEGADLQKLYGVDQYPAVLAMSDSGSLIRLWQGLPMPLMDELSYYIADTQPTLSHSGKTIMPLSGATAVI